MATGYSGTPLARKLGLKEGGRCVLIDAPADYPQWIAPAPPGLRFEAALSGATELVHVFASWRAQLQPVLAECRATLGGSAAVWVSWPKKASKRPTDITEDTIRELALPLGFVDVKVCAVSEVWSGLKLVVRKALR